VALYALKDTETIQEGVQKSKEILREGGAYRIFEKLVFKLGNPKGLEKYD